MRVDDLPCTPQAGFESFVRRAVVRPERTFASCLWDCCEEVSDGFRGPTNARRSVLERPIRASGVLLEIGLQPIRHAAVFERRAAQQDDSRSGKPLEGKRQFVVAQNSHPSEVIV